MIDKYYNVYKHYSNFNQHGFDLQIRIVARAIRQDKKVLHRKLKDKKYYIYFMLDLQVKLCPISLISGKNAKKNYFFRLQ